MTTRAAASATSANPATVADERLAGRVAVVTGAASGIGVATARSFVAAGAQVGLLARRADRLQALAAELGPENAIALPADVADPDALGAAATALADRFGATDLVVANAGVMLPSPLDDGRSDEWRRMIDVNLFGVLETTRAFLPALTETAGRKGVSDLILISSLGARVTFSGYSVYGATKAAVSYLAAAWREELAERGVRVTVVEPGLTESELAGHVSHSDMAGQLEGMFEQIPALAATDVADLLTHTAALPARASLPSLPILPARQA
jgi:NADP-dependent 3-hydroxy acid dehydrogenase YdfG